MIFVAHAVYSLALALSRRALIQGTNPACTLRSDEEVVHRAPGVDILVHICKQHQCSEQNPEENNCKQLFYR